jgi:DNA modification methylase
MSDHWQVRIKSYEVLPVEDFLAQYEPHPKNPRQHGDEQTAGVRGSLDALGVYDVVIVSEKTGLFTDGHLRADLYSLKPGQPVPFVVTDLDADEQHQALATHDFLTTLATYNRDMLDGLLKDVVNTTASVNAVLAELAEQNDLYFGDDEDEPADAPGAQVDKAEALREKWGTERGQLWAIGEHRLLCGDATDAGDVDRVMGGEHASLVITDPPYGVNYDGGTIKRDKLQGDHSADLYLPYLKEVYNLSEDSMALYLFYADGDSAVLSAVLSAGFTVRSNLIWNKNQAQFGALSAQYKQKHEPFFYCHKKGNPPCWKGPTNEVTVWDVARANKNKHHPTEKPPELFQRAMKNSSTIGAIVFDGFGGSGTTMVACEQTGRQCRMIEIEPRYVAVILERMSDMGLEPELVEGD